MRKLVLALAGLFAFQASAQNLTKAEEGRVAIANCYATCMARGERLALAGLARLDRLVDLTLNPQFLALDAEDRAALVVDERELICLLAQEDVRNADACQTGCVDLEVAYDFRRSNARERFNQALRDAKADLSDSGLWVNYRNSPDPGTDAFSAACDEYFSDNGASAGAFLPNRVRPAELAAPKQPAPNND